MTRIPANVDVESHIMYKVYFREGDNLVEAFFPSRISAEKFAKLVNGTLNKYQWQVDVEP